MGSVEEGSPINSALHQFEATEANLAKHERDVFDDAGGGDDFIGGVGSEIELSALARNLQSDRKDLDALDKDTKGGGIEVEGHASAVGKHRQFPKNNVRKAQFLVSDTPVFLSGQGAVQERNDDVGVKIEHPIFDRWKRYCP